ncbi:MAG TPA: hypothetical protein VF596_01145 [Pyrinomonadaceae bacterium]
MTIIVNPYFFVVSVGSLFKTSGEPENQSKIVVRTRRLPEAG